MLQSIMKLHFCTAQILIFDTTQFHKVNLPKWTFYVDWTKQKYTLWSINDLNTTIFQSILMTLLSDWSFISTLFILCSMIQVSYDFFTPKEIMNSDYQISTLNLKNTIYLNYSNNEKLALSFTLLCTIK